MSPRPDDRAPIRDSPRITVPAQRRSPEQERVLADDRLIEMVRADLVTADSPRVARLLARWRRWVLAGA